MDIHGQAGQNSEKTSYRILIVDDEDHHRALEKEILSTSDYEIVEAINGDQALNEIRQQDFDAVLLDRTMPGISGDEVCLQIREVLGETLLPIIMVTGSHSPTDISQSFHFGANDFIKKPYHPIELLARVKAAVTHKRMTDQLDSVKSMLFALARMVEAKDENTGDHCSRLEYMAEIFGHALELDEEQIVALCRGGILHDIGKLGVPDSILLKRGPLSSSEWAIMRQHTVIGARLCGNLKSMRMTVPVIRYHHERWDGSGYPDGLKGKDIPLLARVFQIIDIYDALIHKRPYKEAIPQGEVVHIMQAEVDKGWRDPELMSKFLDIAKSRPDDLVLPQGRIMDQGVSIFADIKSTGALDWETQG